ncbi:MAG: DUF342 domain-containing protein [Lachnospiraceae bacterium]|nr:DUF342 domain-containing protein [Lachnospiraceae bacterium]
MKKEESGFDSDQLVEIEAGQRAGIDVSQYANKEFLAIQMRQIRQGLEEGLDVSVYAKTDYDWFQMEEIREGLKTGVDIGKYASPEISYDRMRQIRKGLRQGIDLSPFSKLDPRVLRQLRKAYVSHVNIVEYVQKGYKAEQLEPIRMALERGLTIPDFLTKEFRGVAIREICLGLARGIDVGFYAQIDFSWQQMREIRMGLEKRIDVTEYAKHLFSWQQMREIRLGLEEGLDVSPYRSLMYTATDMRRIRKQLLEELTQGTVVQRKKTVHHKEFDITISSDELEAHIVVKGSADTEYSFDEVKKALKKEGIVSGIQKEEIRRMLKEKRYQQPVLVAKGMPAKQGKDGWYEFFFRTDLNRTPKLLEDGSVDYQSVEWFELVEEGQKLAYYHEAKKGEVGFTVTGRMLTAVNGKEQKVLSGRGFLLLEDKKTYMAAYNGKVELRGSKLDVSKICIVPEVTQATGNIEFDGCLYVKGDIGRGTTVHATEDIVVDGVVDAASITCGGNLLLRRGVNGIGDESIESHIEVAKKVEGKYFEGVKVTAGGDIHANYCLNCDLHAGDKIIISGTKGVLAGGTARALKEIQSHSIGNRAQIVTKLYLGKTETMNEEKHRLEKKLKEVLKELTILNNAYEKYKKKYEPEVRNSMDIYLRIEAAIYTKEQQKKKIENLQKRNMEEMKQIEGAKAVVQGTLYEGTIIEIAKNRWEASEMKNVTIQREGQRVTVSRN